MPKPVATGAGTATFYYTVINGLTNIRYIIFFLYDQSAHNIKSALPSFITQVLTLQRI
jgi:hypothetical protein